MPENEPLSYDERLEVVYGRVADSAPSNRALRQIATVGNTLLRFSSSDLGDLTVSMFVPTDNAHKLYVFGSREEGKWVPMTQDSGAEEFAQLVELAEAAEWIPESD